MRTAEVERNTRETQIQVSLNLDGTGSSSCQTGIGMLDHLLDQLTLYSRFDLQLSASGDLDIDTHHTVEDCALTLGMAFKKALGDKSGIVRMSSTCVPMDEALALIALDLCDRPYAVINIEWNGELIGPIPTSQIEHFLRSFAMAAGITLHATIQYGRDNHHQAEALFKALGRALDQAVRIDTRLAGQIPSSKGVL